MKLFSVRELSKLAGVSPRMLRYYDAIELLKPKKRARSGYRYYGQKELLKLQQILFFKELDFPLKEIATIVNTPNFDPQDSLTFHRENLKKRIKRLRKLLKTVNRTLLQLNQNNMTNDQDLYEGLSEERAKAYRQEAAQRWGEGRVKQSENRLKKLTKAQFKAVQDEGSAIYQEVADLMKAGESTESEKVQAVIAKHYQHLHHFYDPNPELYASLADLYVQDERFTAFFEKIAQGLAQFMSEAMKVYVKGLPK